LLSHSAGSGEFSIPLAKTTANKAFFLFID
jgi:hypothetical protein